MNVSISDADVMGGAAAAPAVPAAGISDADVLGAAAPAPMSVHVPSLAPTQHSGISDLDVMGQGTPGVQDHEVLFPHLSAPGKGKGGISDEDVHLPGVVQSSILDGKPLPAGVGPSLARKARLWQEISSRNAHDLNVALNEMLGNGSSTWGGRIWGALHTVGAFMAETSSPVEWLLAQQGESTARVAGASEEKAQAIGRKVGEYGSFAAQVALDPAAGVFTAGKKIAGIPTSAMHPTAIADKAVALARKNPKIEALESMISPATRSPEAAKMAEILVASGTKQAARYWAAQQNSQHLERSLNKIVELGLTDQGKAQWWDMMDKLSRGQQQTGPVQQAFADTYRMLFDDLTKDLQARGWLENAREHYVGAIWKQPKDYLNLVNQIEKVGSKRPWAGSKNFLKPKTFEYFSEAREAGMEPVTWNPVELMLIKYREMSKFMYVTDAANEAKAALPVRFYRGNKLPDGIVVLNDPYWKAILPPMHVINEVLHETSFDPGIKRGLDLVQSWLGNPALKTPLRGQDPHLASGALGYHFPPTGETVSRFGNALTTLMHEVGHGIDEKFGLWQHLAQNPKAWRELGELALTRRPQLSNNPAARRLLDPLLDAKYPYSTQSDLHYLLSGKERVAHLFHAYWYAPDLLKKVAPEAFKSLKEWLGTVGTAAVDAKSGLQLREAIDLVKPTLATETAQIAERFETKGAGWQHLGQWGAPEPIAHVFNNYISQGLFSFSGNKGKGAPFWDGIRHAGNYLNMFQLGLSGFHLVFTSVDAGISETARAIEQAFHGEFGKAFKTGAGSLVPVPFAAGVKNWVQGEKLRKGLAQYFSAEKSGMDPKTKQLVEYFLESGGRPQMDVFYRAVDKGLIQRLKDGTFYQHVMSNPEARKFTILGQLPIAAYKIAMMAMQSTMHPIMEVWVPRLKLGVWSNLAKDAIARNPTISMVESRSIMQKAWESVDNRMGQMVYDNLFWDKILKDIAFMSVRSVGWNIGTIRELGGAGVDLQKTIRAWGQGEKLEMTHRMAYSIGMVIHTAMWGAVATYLYTGKGPTEWKDYFFPPTGATTQHGGKARVPIPSYIKDVLSYNDEPVKTVMNKMNPLWSFIYQIYDNRDFYGGIIYDPKEDLAGRAVDFMEYLSEQVMPFSIRSARKLRKESADLKAQIGSYFGLQQAPGYITDPEVGAGWRAKQDAQALRRRQRERDTQ